MAAYKGSTGLEYTRTVDEAEEQKQRMAASIDRTYSIASGVFAMGLIAVGALCCISVLNNAPRLAIGCEIVVFVCLIVLLVLIARAKRRMSEQRRHSERFPYKSVDKKEIDRIFDIIADEEKKRERLDRFAMSGTSAARKPVVDEPPLSIVSMDRSGSEPESKPSRPEEEPVKSKTNEPEEDSGIIHIFPEEEEMVSVLDDEINDVELMLRADVENEEAQKKEEASENKEPEEEKSEREPESSEEPPRKKRPRSPDGSRPPQSGKRPSQGQGQKGKRRPPVEGTEREYRDSRAPRDPRDPRAPQRGESQQGVKKRRPPAYDPYYGGGAYYYDEYGRPISRRPPAYDPYYGGGYYYDEYGQPVRRREPGGAVYYDEYGRPIRRRPPQGYDPRREEAVRRKRAANGADPAKRRPDPTKAGQQAVPNAPARPGASSGPKAPQPESRRTAAPVAMPSLKKDFDEERVAVSIPDFEDRDNSYENEQVTLRADRARPISKTPPAPPKPVVVDESEYSPRDMEAVPIVIPDDDYYSRYDDEEQAYVPPASSAARQQRGSSAPPARSANDYSYDVDDVPPEEQDAGVVVVPDFSDYDENEYEDRYSRGRYRSGSPSGEREQAYQPPVSQSAPSKPAYSPEAEEDYSYEDEGVVVLPHDEGYESYLEKVKEEEEKKRIEERKLARKKSGKIALTIKKVRRKKIHRRSRRYKRFRASVVPLAKYLCSYDS